MTFEYFWTLLTLVFIITKVEIRATTNTNGMSTPIKFQRVLLRGVDLNKSSLNTTLWANDGYKETNATQISHSLKKGAKLNSSARFLMGTLDAKLCTTLPNFSQNLLSIKFSSMIGKSLQVNSAASPPKQPAIHEETVSNNNKAAHLTMTPAITTNFPITPSKLQTVGENKQVIQRYVAVEPVNSDNEEILGYHPASSVFTEQEQNKHKHVSSQIIIEQQSPVKRRKRRESNTGDSGSFFRTTKDSPSLSGLLKTVIEPLVVEHIPAPTGKHNLPETPGVAADSNNLQFKTWKASLNQDFRPPGFYVLIDDYILYDNWEGIWYRQEPNVLGKNIKSSASDIWSHTEILIEWKEPPKRDVKVRFEWTPASTEDDDTNFIFLKDIQITTFNIEDDLNRPSHHDTQTNTNNNITLNLVLKFQPSINSKEPDIIISDGNESGNVGLAKNVASTVGTTTPSTTIKLAPIYPKPVPTIPIIKTTTTIPKTVANLILDPKATSLSNYKSGSYWTIPLIVSVVIGSVCLLILILALFIKTLEQTRVNSYC